RWPRPTPLGLALWNDDGWRFNPCLVVLNAGGQVEEKEGQGLFAFGQGRPAVLRKLPRSSVRPLDQRNASVQVDRPTTLLVGGKARRCIDGEDSWVQRHAFAGQGGLARGRRPGPAG